MTAKFSVVMFLCLFVCLFVCLFFFFFFFNLTFFSEIQQVVLLLMQVLHDYIFAVVMMTFFQSI